tara:strand:- start:401 stop:613 length:213 start_codon:yes stop_codon:yes gene_type:complete
MKVTSLLSPGPSDSSLISLLTGVLLSNCALTEVFSAKQNNENEPKSARFSRAVCSEDFNASQAAINHLPV